MAAKELVARAEEGMVVAVKAAAAREVAVKEEVGREAGARVAAGRVGVVRAGVALGVTRAAAVSAVGMECDPESSMCGNHLL